MAAGELCGLTLLWGESGWNMSEIINPPGHEHRTSVVGGQKVCMDCHQVIIAPKLEFSDFDNQSAANGQPNSLWLEAVKSLCPMQIDFLWIELSDRLGCDWPDYIDKLSEHYSGENPPHTESGPYAWGF